MRIKFGYHIDYELWALGIGSVIKTNEYSFGILIGPLAIVLRIDR